MPRIDSSQLTALIRAQLDAVRRGQSDAVEKPIRGKKTQAGANAPTERAKSDGTAPLVSGLKQRIGIAIRQIAADDPNRRRKAFRAFLEAILLNELGEELRSDPAFSKMVDEVHERMEQDESLRAACARSSDVLLSQAFSAGTGTIPSD